MTIDPVTLAVIKGRLEQIADEMDVTLFRAAFSPVIAEARDASHGIYEAGTGDTLIQGKEGLPIFVGVMSFAVKAGIEKAAADGGAEDGDLWIFNDPYVGGTHLSDFKIVRPYFHDGELFCWLASVAHWHDVGGGVPGNYNPSATDCFQEGFVLPPSKLMDKGVLREDVVSVVTANSRLPGSSYGDLMGQINSLDLGIRRMDDLVDDYGAVTVQSVFVELKERSRQQMRSLIGELPDGTYSSEDFLDNDGIEDKPLKVALDMTITGETLKFDFSRSAAACAGPLNISYTTTVAATYVALKHVFREVPANGGVLEPIAFVIPDGKILSAVAPRPVGGYTETIQRLIDVVFSAFAKADPDIAPANGYGTINAVSINGRRPGEARPWVFFTFFGGGLGAHSEGDGLTHGNASISMATIPPAEILEAALPVIFTQWSVRPNSAGPGKYRGGFGAIYEMELIDERGTGFVFGERGRFAPKGISGGGEAALDFVAYDEDDERCIPTMTSKAVGIRLKRGHRIRIESPGGGGYGPAVEREPGLVARDVRLELLSRENAELQYGVVLTSAGEVDEAATTATRQTMDAAE
ncbi:MAG: hydantoin utilization protein B [Rhodospirillaceae bacterium]|nr:hydantoin utilization protein B [Rhodospirillaceae bacterium]|tara:strand:- start:2685 stop:4427 length:1743 start_codon:yes stop_codon:yes gene_type:complete